MKKILIGIAVILGTICSAWGQEERPRSIYKSILLGFEYEVNAGVNLGGASPIPLPQEIRKIEGFNPLLNLSIGATVYKWFDQNRREQNNTWGIAFGFRLEQKGMETDASVKNYGMTIVNEGNQMSGRWTGKVHTRYVSQLFTIPVVATYRLNSRWRFNFGPYVAFLMKKDFEGRVYDGYLREGDPTGPKWEFTDGKYATYDFNQELRTFNWGLQAGAAFRVFKRLSVNLNLDWGLNDIFRNSFETVTFDMYPIYANIGFAYVF